MGFDDAFLIVVAVISIIGIMYFISDIFMIITKQRVFNEVKCEQIGYEYSSSENGILTCVREDANGEIIRKEFIDKCYAKKC